MMNPAYDELMSPCCNSTVVLRRKKSDASTVAVCLMCSSEISSRAVVWLLFDSASLIPAGVCQSIRVENRYDESLQILRLWIEEEESSAAFMVENLVCNKISVIPYVPVPGSYFNKAHIGSFSGIRGEPILFPRFGNCSIEVSNHRMHAIRFKAVLLCRRIQSFDERLSSHLETVDRRQTSLSDSLSSKEALTKPCYNCTSPTTEKLLCKRCQSV